MAYINGKKTLTKIINTGNGGGIEGVEYEEGGLSINDKLPVGTDIHIQNGVVGDVYVKNNTNVFLGNDDNVIAFNDGVVATENLEPQNIVKDVTILGVTGTFEGGSGGNTLKNLLDATKQCNQMFYKVKLESVDNLIGYNDTENVTDLVEWFYYSTTIKKIPLVNTSNVETVHKAFYGCTALETIPQLNFSNVSSDTYLSGTFYNCKALTSLLAYGIKFNFSIAQSTLLEAPALVTILSNCQVITSTQTLTLGSTLLAKLEGVYVKETGVEQYEGITCRPCVICESTDAGAMLATEYFTAKGWTLA